MEGQKGKPTALAFKQFFDGKTYYLSTFEDDEMKDVVGVTEGPLSKATYPIRIHQVLNYTSDDLSF